MRETIYECLGGALLAAACGVWHYRLRRALPYVATAATVASALLLPRSTAAAAIASASLSFFLARRSRCVGLTGGIACGKSTVARAFQASGATVLDLDALAREVVAPGAPAWRDLVAHFGRGVLQSDGGALAPLDRAALRAIIARDATARAFVNSVTHPRIFSLLLRRVAWHRWLLGRAVVIEAPLLFESGLLLRMLCAPIVCVTAGDGGSVLQEARIISRDASPPDVARALVASQLSIAEKAALSDEVLVNGAESTVASLGASATHLWKDRLASV